LEDFGVVEGDLGEETVVGGDCREDCNGPPLHDYFYTLYSFPFIFYID
jgi:hypothetical protein